MADERSSRMLFGLAACQESSGLIGRLSLSDASYECVYHRGVELRSRVPAQLDKCPCDRDSRLIRAIGGHRVKCVDNSDDACTHRNFVKPETIGIAASIRALMYRANDRRDRLEIL